MTREDIQKLRKDQFLNDVIIDAYFLLVNKRVQRQGRSDICFCTTMLSSVLLQTPMDEAILMRTAKAGRENRTIFSYSRFIIPIHQREALHWTLVVLDVKKSRARYFDSLRWAVPDQLKESIDRWLNLERAAANIQQKSTNLTWENVETPQQDNGSDCGMFTCLLGSRLAIDAPINDVHACVMYTCRQLVACELATELHKAYGYKSCFGVIAFGMMLGENIAYFSDSFVASVQTLETPDAEHHLRHRC